jgi:UDP-N-acetylglucosamine diphosphorylase/glucosamine-1-phosphate N-acetyltransferase
LSFNEKLGFKQSFMNMTQVPENIILFGDDTWFHLLPLTFTRPIGELRIGILTIREKWAFALHNNISYITQDYLSEKYPLSIAGDNLLINGSFLPDPVLLSYITQLRPNQAIFWGNDLIAAHMTAEQIMSITDDKEGWQNLAGTDLSGLKNLSLTRITRPHHLFEYNDQELKKDFKLLTANRQSQPISESNKVFGKFPVFLEEGVTMEASILNTEKGPVYLGKNALIMEGCMIRGGLALCEQAILKMGTKVYGPTTLGPHCKAGGELNNIVMLGYSNKGHDGYLGNSVIGEWCNLGADTNASNLKNDYDTIRLWSYVNKKFEETGLTFCGLIMGDHSKSAINTMFNTGTVVGVGCNIHGAGFPRNYIPCFTKGGSQSYTKQPLSDFVATSKRVLQRKELTLTDHDIAILEHIFHHHESMTP